MGFGVAFGLVFMLIMAVAIPLAGLMFIVAVAKAFIDVNNGEGTTQPKTSDTPASAASKRRMKEPEPEINMCPRCGAVTDNKKVCKCGAKTKPIEEVMAEEEWA